MHEAKSILDPPRDVDESVWPNDAPRPRIPKEIRDIVIFDDASYSGLQLSRIIDDLVERSGKRNIRIHVVVPFMTTGAKTRTLYPHRYDRNHGWIKTTPSIKRHNVYLYDTRTMSTIAEILTSVPQNQDGSLLALAQRIYPRFNIDLPLTYFQHAIPDWKLLGGLNLHIKPPADLLLLTQI